MPAFEYEALQPDGRRTRGLTEADSERHARRLIRDIGLLPLAVKRSNRSAAGDTRPKSALFAPRLRGDKVVLLTRLLGTLLQSALPMDDALAAIAKQSGDTNLRRTVLDIRSKVLEGHSLETSLAQFPSIFPDVYRATVGAGEQTRHLPLVLQRLADYMDQRQELRMKVRLAMIYPLILVVVAVTVVTGLLVYVVPEVVKVFEHTDHELPRLTVYLIATSEFMSRFGLIVLAAGIALTFALRRLFDQPRYRRWLHRLLLRLPVVGRFIVDSDAGRFARTLSILLASGVDMLDALTIAGKSIMNTTVRGEIEAAAARVREGEALSRALVQAKTIPPLLTHLIANGENSGDLPRMLETAAVTHERDVQLQIAIGLNLLEPALILLMGGMVLAIVLAILIPIFEMNQLV